MEVCRKLPLLRPRTLSPSDTAMRRRSGGTGGTRSPQGSEKQGWPQTQERPVQEHVSRRHSHEYDTPPRPRHGSVPPVFL
ncbi:hypothetical protein AAFF_G00346790 [Aldrovandia affinis]|uniref:Uncharacterized protein n=1 Tax=Aldrovandia affinis TaxID=143900 RepID=A0AAD7WNQ4_9TELE|nr:hypothetical protein AAFF_G00346790 [Aldrovandia affinis]